MLPLKIYLLVLLAVLLGAADGLIISDEGPPGSNPGKSPVYFPILPEDFKDFGIKISRDPDTGRGGKKLDMPITTTKPTTTTDRLPINPNGVLSHVAPETATNPPGPSYLTDSFYYLDDHTPLPGSEELSLEDIVLELPELDRESEDQELQILGPLPGDSFGKKMPAFALLDPLSVPALNTPSVTPTSEPVTLPHSLAAPVRTPTRPPATIPTSAPTAPTRAPTSEPTSSPATIPTSAPTAPTPATTPPTYIPSRLARPPSKILRKPSTPTRAPSRNVRPTGASGRGPVRSTTYTPRRTKTPTAYNPARRVSRPLARATTPAPTSTTASPIAHKPLKLRPAFTPIPTSAPNILAARVPSAVYASDKPSRTSRPSSRKPSSQVPARVPIRSQPSSVSARPVTSRPVSVRLVSRRPKFESSRLTAKSKTSSTPRPTPTPASVYHTPTPPTTNTTSSSSSRGYGRRTSASSPPRREHVSSRDRLDGSPVYRTSTKAYRAPSSLYHVRGATTTVTAPAQPDFVQSDPNIYVPVEYDEEAIPGEAGIDYPNYQVVPDTPFTCDAQEHPGLYADTDAQCQTFHICQEDGRQNSFLCPNGTVFNQQYFVCDWWYNFSCDHAHRFYSLNAFIYELPEAGKYAKK